MLIKDFIYSSSDTNQKIKELQKILSCLYDKELCFYDYKIKVVQKFGGEGKGDLAWNVYEFSNKDGTNKHNMKVDLYYCSYDGYCWDDWFDSFYEVELKEVVREEWFAK